MWKSLVSNVKGTRGPFSKPSKKGDTDRILALAVELFPAGPPVRGKPWLVKRVGHPEDFAKIATFLFDRNV